MTSRIYAAGVRATAVAQIKADVGAMYVTGADGAKRLDRAALANYLMVQFGLVSGDGTPPSATTADVDAAARNFPLQPLVDTLDNALKPERFMDQPNWPASFGRVTGGTLVSAIKTAQAKTAAAAAEVTGLYRWTQTDALVAGIKNVYDELKLDDIIPKGIERVLHTTTYRCAYRTDKGEISKASDASPLVTLDQNDAVQLTAPAPPSGRNIVDVLWYRANSLNAGAAFQFVDVKPVADGLDYLDEKRPEDLGEPCPSIEWDYPNADLRGMHTHPAGFGVAFFGNTLCLSVLNRMYAWPINIRKTTARPIVGIALAGTTIFVGTQGEPYLASGSDPAFISMERVSGGYACRSAASIVATSVGFVYAGPDGLVRCNGTKDVEVLTTLHWTKEQWEALQPETMFGAEHNGCYYLWTNGGAACYSLGLKPGGKMVTVDIAASAAFLNTANGKLYVASGTGIKEVFGGATRRTAVWKSPRVSLAKAASFAWRKLIGDYENGAVTLTVTRFFPDGTGDTITQTATSRNASRWPGGKPDEYEIQISGQSGITTLALAGDTGDLRQ